MSPPRSRKGSTGGGPSSSGRPCSAIPPPLFLSDAPATVAKGEHRRRSVFLGTPELAARWRVSGGRWAAANLVVPWLIAGNLVRTRRVRAIEWRGERDGVGPPNGAI